MPPSDADASAAETLAWDLPEPFILERVARPEDADGFGHVNNGVYVRWLGEAAWAHSEALGLSEAACVAMDRGFVIRRTEIDYLAAAAPGDAVRLATWIIENDGRLRSRRRFQLVRQADARTLVRAEMLFVSVRLSTGEAVRMPDEFKTTYPVPPAVAAALATG